MAASQGGVARTQRVTDGPRADPTGKTHLHDVPHTRREGATRFLLPVLGLYTRECRVSGCSCHPDAMLSTTLRNSRTLFENTLFRPLDA
jgi:hypothetical protein